MSVLLSVLGALLISASAIAVEIPDDDERREFQEAMLLGQVRYFSSVGDHHRALQLVADNELLSEAQLRKRLRAVDGAEPLSLASIELAYRMNQRAGNAVRAVLDASVDLDRRNQAAYELAQIYYRKQDYEYARFALQLIRGDTDDALQQDMTYLGAMIDARTGQSERAIQVLAELKDEEGYLGFAGFNLAHLLMQSGESEAALTLYEDISLLRSDDDVMNALAEKARVVLGYHHMTAGDHAAAIEHLSRVSLDGVFTNRALLGLAWAHMRVGDEQAALVAWTHLNARRPIDAAVLESYVAIPFLYSKLGLHSKAASHYEKAVDRLQEYESALKLTRAIVGSGDIIPVGEESETREASIVDELLVDLLASKEYREAWYNYRDLVNMSRELERRQASLHEMMGLLNARSDSLLSSEGDPAAVMTSVRQRLEQIREQLSAAGSQDESLSQRLARLEQRVESLEQPGNPSADYLAFQLPVTELVERADELAAVLDDVRQRQADQMRGIAATALDGRIALIGSYAATARFERAKSYDILAEMERQE